MNAALEALRTRFRDRAASDALAIETALVQGDEGWEDLQTVVHSLAGAAGIFGHPKISDAAIVLDTQFASGDRPSPEDLRALVAIIRTDLADYS